MTKAKGQCKGTCVVESPRTPIQVVRTKAPPSPIKMRMLELQFAEDMTVTPWEILSLDITTDKAK